VFVFADESVASPPRKKGRGEKLTLTPYPGKKSLTGAEEDEPSLDFGKSTFFFFQGRLIHFNVKFLNIWY